MPAVFSARAPTYVAQYLALYIPPLYSYYLYLALYIPPRSSYLPLFSLANRSYYFYYKKAMVNICSTCGKSFKHASSLSRHITNVHKDKEFKCDVCQQQLSSKCSLDRHRRVKHKFEYVPYVKKE